MKERNLSLLGHTCRSMSVEVREQAWSWFSPSHFLMFVRVWQSSGTSFSLEALRGNSIATGTSAEAIGLGEAGMGACPLSTREVASFHTGAGPSGHTVQGFVVTRTELL